MAEAATAVPAALVRRGAQILAAVSHSVRQLRLNGRDIQTLAPLAGEWLLRGAGADDLREALVNGLPQPVHCPAALLRDRLVRKRPEIPRQRVAAGPPLAPRVAGMVECRGRHIQPRLFRPEADEVLCGECREEDGQAAAHAEITARGAAAVRAVLRRG
ncbi:hypothetical protein [Streptomyces orinoci]|uniref:Uncharacterized protein n=1 Tax=Streptomyces orinoci TaxID=67339 RepID=A0ABV3JWU1_STRON|nr:hypothetical protein [Streptomyces orinoci]